MVTNLCLTRLADRFLAAARNGDLRGLEELLALLVTTGGRPLAVLALEFEDTLVAGIRIIATPEKLSHLTVPLSSQGA